MKYQYSLLSFLVALQLSGCSNEPKKSVVVAKSDVTEGYQLTADQFQIGDVEVSKLPTNPLTNVAEATGVTKRTIPAGGVLSKDDILFPPTSLFAKRDLPGATELVMDDVEVKTLSKGGHENDKFVPSKDGVVGRTMIRAKKAGEPIFGDDLGPKVMFH